MKKYVKPYMDIVEFDTDDIITTSSPENTVYDADVSGNMSETPITNNAKHPTNAEAQESRADTDRTIPRDDINIGDVDYFFSPD